MQTYMTAGDFTVGQRLKTSLKANAVAYLSLGLIAFILIISLSVKKHMTLLVPLSRPRKTQNKQNKETNKEIAFALLVLFLGSLHVCPPLHLTTC